MAELKKITPDKILWLDLEMTGLNPKNDRILEFAAVVTDWQFNELESMQAGVGHDSSQIKKLLDNNTWFDDYPENKQAMLQMVSESQPEKIIEQSVLYLIDRHFDTYSPVLLAGNSIHMDRQFIRQWWPKVEERLHYRMLDVSAWKVVMIGRYGLEFPKKETHRALDDIYESIAELKMYLSKMELEPKK